MSTSAARSPAGGAWMVVRSAWESLSVYLPIMLMGLMALGTYWLARNTPALATAEAQRAATHDPDYFMRRFSVKTFDATGRLKSEIYGAEARHFPDTDTIEIDQPRIRSYNARGELTVSTADRAVSNADGSEVQLVGHAVVTREATATPGAPARQRLEFRGEFLHAFMDTERVKSHKPVELIRGADRFTADTLDYDNQAQVLDLRGRVRGTIAPGPRR